ncbi:MAG: DUF5666 domain-containing protein [Woeseiaceae bacterium]|nr:DUF5666 domain-containing protein [Woeseiaceae bacterium]
MKNLTFVKLLGLSLAALLAGCGSSGGSDDASNANPALVAATPQTTVGQITGFGSVYVNGVRYDTSSATYDVDDDAATGDDSLAVGMVVKIQGSVNADGRSGEAQSVSYDDDIEGIVENLATDPEDEGVKTFTIFGVSIRAIEGRTNFDAEDDPDFSFLTIMNGDNVEVSGAFDGDVLVASYIEKQDASDDDFEAKGTVTAYDGSSQFVLVLKNDAALNVTIAPGAETPSAGIADGQYVEVEGSIPDPVNAPADLLATKVEREDEDRLGDDDDDDVEIKGTLSFDPESDTWSVMGIALSFDSQTRYFPMSLEDSIANLSAHGLYVEVEGRYVDDVLLVDEIELEEDDLEFKADVQEVNATAPRDGTITLSFGPAMGTIEVRVTPDTIFLDDTATTSFDLSSITSSDQVEIDARRGSDGAIYASTLHIEDDLGYEIEGPVTAIDEVSIRILTVTFTIGAETFFENGVPQVEDFVELEDENGDGVADVIEIDD